MCLRICVAGPLREYPIKVSLSLPTISYGPTIYQGSLKLVRASSRILIREGVILSHYALILFVVILCTHTICGYLVSLVAF